MLGTQNILVGVNQNDLMTMPITEHKPRSLERYGQPLNLISGVVQVPVASPYDRDLQITVKHDKPLPMKLLALEVDFK